MSPARSRSSVRPRLRASILVVVFAFLTIDGGSTSAQTLEGLTIGAEAFRFERSSRGRFDLESDDPLVGARLGYTHKFYGAWFVRVHGRYARGEASTTFSDGDRDQDIPQQIWEARLEWGRDMGFEGTIGLAPYIGIGYRHYRDEGFGNQTRSGALLFDTTVEFVYIPVGFTAYFSLGDAWTISTQAEIAWLFDGKSDNETSDLPGFNFDVNADLSTGTGLAAEILIRKRLTKSYSIAFGPFVKYWDIDDSNPDNGFFVPDNDTLEAGITFKMNIGPPL